MGGQQQICFRFVGRLLPKAVRLRLHLRMLMDPVGVWSRRKSRPICKFDYLTELGPNRGNIQDLSPIGLVPMLATMIWFIRTLSGPIFLLAGPLLPFEKISLL